MRLRWWVPLLPLRSIARSLRGIEHQLHRLADVYEGITPARPLDEGEAPIEIVRSVDYAAAYQIEERLRATLRRDPTPEEIEHELEGWEHAASLDRPRAH